MRIVEKTIFNFFQNVIICLLGISKFIFKIKIDILKNSIQTFVIKIDILVRKNNFQNFELDWWNFKISKLIEIIRVFHFIKMLK